MKTLNIFFGLLALASFTVGVFDILFNAEAPTPNDNAIPWLVSFAVGSIFTVIFLITANIIQKSERYTRHGLE